MSPHSRLSSIVIALVLTGCAPAGATQEQAQAPRDDKLAAEAKELVALVMEEADFKDFVVKHVPSRLDAWREAAEAGRPEAQVLYGLCLEYSVRMIEGTVVAVGEPDVALSRPWYRKAAEQGYAPAQFLVAKEIGLGDKPEALRWLSKAIAQGFAPAQYEMGNYLLWIHTGASRDALSIHPSEAVPWYRKAAEQGHAGAAGMLYALPEALSKPTGPAEVAAWRAKSASISDGRRTYLVILTSRALNRDKLMIEERERAAGTGRFSAAHRQLVDILGGGYTDLDGIYRRYDEKKP